MASSNNEYYSVAFQNGANTIFNFQQTNAIQALQPSGTTQFKSDFDRMKAKIASNAYRQGAIPTNNYNNSLYSRFYSLNSAPPSSNGPGNSGWGSQIGTPGAYDPIYFVESDSRIQKTTNVGIVTAGFLYSPSNTTVRFQTVSDDGIRLDFNGSNIINSFIPMSQSTITSVACQLYSNQFHPITLTYYQGAGTMTCQLYYNIASNGFTNDGLGLLYHNYRQL